MIAGSEDSTVRRFDKNTLEFLGNVTQTEAIGIFCLSIDPKGKKVAVGSQCVKLYISLVKERLTNALVESLC